MTPQDKERKLALLTRLQELVEDMKQERLLKDSYMPILTSAVKAAIKRLTNTPTQGGSE